MGESLLEIRDLKTHFLTDIGTVRAVDGVSFSIRRGETLGLVGESGCGKSVTALSILQIVPRPGRIVEGEITLRRKDGSTARLDSLPPKGRDMLQIRGGEIGLVFQEPMTSLSPVHTIGNQICENILLHMPLGRKDARDLAVRLLDQVGIPRAGKIVDEYTFQLSGGMRQRAMIALAIACSPSLLIADEPTTAIDVTVQAKILSLLKELQGSNGMSILMITHNLGVIAEMSDRVAVMYLGRIVESGTVYEIFDRPLHPYTAALMKSIPKVDARENKELAVIQGSVPDPYTRPPGCLFASRCEQVMPGVCDQRLPALQEMGDGHVVSCFLYGERPERKENAP